MSVDNEGFGLFRRMARKVTSPSREPGRLGDPDSGPTEYDKAEMKAMIERKRRNDYVRKREFDTLRRIRREGLSGEQAAALTVQSSRLDETDSRPPPLSTPSSGIKAKIDAIERQMVGASSGVSAGHAPKAPATRPGALPPGPPPPVLTTTLFGQDDAPPTRQSPSRSTPPTAPATTTSIFDSTTTPTPLSQFPSIDAPPVVSHFGSTLPTPSAVSQFPSTLSPSAPPTLGTLHFDAPAPLARLEPPQPVRPISLPTLDFEAIELTSVPFAPTAPLPYVPTFAPTEAPVTESPSRPFVHTSVDLGEGESVEVGEPEHDEGLDEPVIAFASGDFAGCERSLQALIAPDAERRDHEETWMVLFDMYRAIGQQGKFEALTMEYAETFHRSGPPWYSLPRMLAEATATPADAQAQDTGVGWVCPARLDGEAVNRLEALSMQLPLPWVMDWTALATVEAEGASRLQKLFSTWASQPITMRWIGGERLLAALQEAAPAGVRDVDPVYWMLRLESLRLAHRPDQFDEVAIDYCVTFEVSPPSWENARCKARFAEGAANTRTMSLSVVGEPVTSFMDTRISEDDYTPAPTPLQMTTIELSGQLSGDIGELLARLTQQAGESHAILISCAMLMRVDFVAAGDLLNWVVTRHVEGRDVVFQQTHRLVALMFGAMGINDHARVQLRVA